MDALRLPDRASHLHTASRLSVEWNMEGVGEGGCLWTWRSKQIGLDWISEEKSHAALYWQPVSGSVISFHIYCCCLSFSLFNDIAAAPRRLTLCRGAGCSFPRTLRSSFPLKDKAASDSCWGKNDKNGIILWDSFSSRIIELNICFSWYLRVSCSGKASLSNRFSWAQ